MKALLLYAGRRSAAAAGGIMLVPAALLCFTGILLGLGVHGLRRDGVHQATAA